MEQSPESRRVTRADALTQIQPARMGSCVSDSLEYFYNLEKFIDEWRDNVRQNRIRLELKLGKPGEC